MWRFPANVGRGFLDDRSVEGERFVGTGRIMGESACADKES
jgi:hypothetical protein